MILAALKLYGCGADPMLLRNELRCQPRLRNDKLTMQIPMNTLYYGENLNTRRCMPNWWWRNIWIPQASRTGANRSPRS